MTVPACPACDAALRESRFLRVRLVEASMAAGTDAMARIWYVAVSCPGCLAAIELEAYADVGTSWQASELVPGTSVSRLRERLAVARTAASVEREVREILGDGKQAWLLGTPELFEFVQEAFGKTVVLGNTAEGFPIADSTPGPAFAPAAHRLFVPAPPKKSRKSKKVEPKRKPLHEGHYVVAKGTRLTLMGVREGELACSWDGRVVLVPPYLAASE